MARRARHVWPALLVVEVALPGAALAQDAREASGNRSGDRSSFGSRLKGLKKTVPGQVRVRCAEGNGGTEQATVRREEGVVKKADLDLVGGDMVKVGEGTAAADLEANPDVEYAVPDRVVYPMEYRDEARFKELWGLEDRGQEILGPSRLEE